MEFCTIEKVEVEGGHGDFAFDGNAELQIRARGGAWYNGRRVDDEIEWSLARIVAPTRLSSVPADARGAAVEFRLSGLPDRNTDFGGRPLSARHRSGLCDCAVESRVRLFFPVAARNHPGNDRSPNWFYYWSQIDAVPPAARPLLRYSSRPRSLKANSTDVLVAIYDHETETITLGDGVVVAYPHGCVAEQTPDGVHSGRKSNGIDCFAETVRHEMQHRQDAIDWWGSPKGMYAFSPADSFLRDPDMDHVPSDVEVTFPGCSPVSKRSCPEVPREAQGETTDAELRAYAVGWTWPIGSADRQDWSCGPLAKQWRGGKCP
jgi:hypothetical protein